MLAVSECWREREIVYVCVLRKRKKEIYLGKKRARRCDMRICMCVYVWGE